MAQASLTLTAVDRTQAAINSALRGMKTVERTAKITAKAVNTAFGIFTGGVLINAFQSVIKAAEKTRDGAKSVKELRDTLADPALVASANAISKALVDGFTVAAGGVVAFAKLVRQELVNIGAIAPVTTGEMIKKLEGQISSIQSKYKFSVKGEMISSPISEADQQIIKELQSRISALQNYRATETSARGRANRPSEFDISQNKFKAGLELDKIAIEQQKELTKAANEARLALAEKQAEANKNYQEMRAQLGEISSLYESTFNAESINIDKNTQAMLDGFIERKALFESFAQDTASAMTNAFAQFLFDPFQNGLKGMLSGFLNVVRQIIAQILAVEILTAIFSPFAGSSGLGGKIYGALTKKAVGGPVSGGKPYIVGERGPELFVPGTSGGIVPNNRLAMGGGVTVAPVYNIDARGATADLQAALPAILSENNRRIFDELDRRYGIGR